MKLQCQSVCICVAHFMKLEIRICIKWFVKKFFQMLKIDDFTALNYTYTYTASLFRLQYTDIQIHAQHTNTNKKFNERNKVFETRKSIAIQIKINISFHVCSDFHINKIFPSIWFVWTHHWVGNSTTHKLNDLLQNKAREKKTIIINGSRTTAK